MVTSLEMSVGFGKLYIEIILLLRRRVAELKKRIVD